MEDKREDVKSQDTPGISPQVHSRGRRWFVEKILVTGHTGFIGRVLTEKLLALGYDVIGYSTSTGQDILDLKQLTEALSDVRFVYHLAAKVNFSKKDRQETEMVNIKGTANMITAAGAVGHIKKIIFASTALTCGLLESPNLKLDETYFVLSPETNPYLYSKAVAESICLQSPQIPIVIVLPSTARPIPSIVAPPGGNNIIDVRDVADGMIAAMEYGRSGQRYLLTDRNITFRKLYKGAIPLPHWSRRIVRLFVNSFLVDNAFCYKYYNNAKAKEELHWTPQHDPIKNYTTWWRRATKRQTEGAR